MMSRGGCLIFLLFCGLQCPAATPNHGGDLADLDRVLSGDPVVRWEAPAPPPDDGMWIEGAPMRLNPLTTLARRTVPDMSSEERAAFARRIESAVSDDPEWGAIAALTMAEFGLDMSAEVLSASATHWVASVERMLEEDDGAEWSSMLERARMLAWMVQAMAVVCDGDDDLAELPITKISNRLFEAVADYYTRILGAGGDVPQLRLTIQVRDVLIDACEAIVIVEGGEYIEPHYQLVRSWVKYSAASDDGNDDFGPYPKDLIIPGLTGTDIGDAIRVDSKVVRKLQSLKRKSVDFFRALESPNPIAQAYRLNLDNRMWYVDEMAAMRRKWQPQHLFPEQFVRNRLYAAASADEIEATVRGILRAQTSPDQDVSDEEREYFQKKAEWFLWSVIGPEGLTGSELERFSNE